MSTSLFHTHTQRAVCFPVFHTHTHGCVFPRFLHTHTHTGLCVSLFHTHTHHTLTYTTHTCTHTHHLLERITHTHHTHIYTDTHIYTHRHTDTHIYIHTDTHTHATAGKDQTWPVLVNCQLIQLSRIHNILNVLFNTRLLEKPQKLSHHYNHELWRGEDSSVLSEHVCVRASVHFPTKVCTLQSLKVGCAP